MPESVRNLALVAHVDHGKTTLVDAMLSAAGAFADHETPVERVMDSSDQERERGITILAKATSVVWRDVRINLVDTPGHADFGGEVERALALVDAILLLVDAAEGPLPQTRYVLSKAMARGLPTVVVLNKVDRPDARPDEVLDEIYQLFIDLDATDIDFPIVSTIAREGRAMVGIGTPGPDAGLDPLLDVIVDELPAPTGDPDAPLQAIVTNLDASDYLGRLAIGRVVRGTLRAGETVALCHANPDEPPLRRRLSQLLGFDGLARVEVAERRAGDLFVVAGFPEVEIGDTIAAAADPEPLERIVVDEPVLRITLGVNTSPLAGRDGTFLTSNQIKDRLAREVLGNVSIRVGPTANPETTEVAGRGELQLAVLIESMRREGFELQVSRPEVIIREIDGTPHEPVERAVIDVPDEYVGTVISAVAPRHGTVEDLRPGDSGRTIVTIKAPARGLLGFRSLLMTATRGTALVHQHHDGWTPWAGELEHRQGGAMIADRAGVATAHALENLQDRGTLFITPGDATYEGMVIGEHSRRDELPANPAKTKELKKMRTANTDDGIKLRPPLRHSLETAIEWIADDELVEVTPSAIRIRKRHLTESERKLAAKRS